MAIRRPIRQGGLMAPIIASTEVARPAQEAFAYVIDPATMSEWQQDVVRGHLDTPTTRVGSKCTTIRRIGGREREVITEITEYDPPRRWADRGISGPIRAIVAVTAESLADGSRSRVTIEVDFTGHGIGKLLVPLIVRRQAAKQMPENMKRLKQRLEASR
jgi:Polyketide cyclase / dehydrase and lipid transport